MQRGTRRRTLITRHRVEDTPHRRRTVAHQSGLARLGVELLAQEVPAFAAWAWQTNWVPGRVVSFSDDLAPATFFMDGNVRAQRWAARLRRSAAVLQQSFVLPIAGRTSAEVDRVEAFVREALDRMRDAGQSAGMFDVGFLPRSEPFLLSPNPDRDAFLVSIAFVARGAPRRHAAERLLAKLTRVCASTYGGTLHLTKQAHCTNEELRAMVRGPIEGLRALSPMKRRAIPRNMRSVSTSNMAPGTSRMSDSPSGRMSTASWKRPSYRQIVPSVPRSQALR